MPNTDLRPPAFDSPAALWRWYLVGLGGLSVMIRKASLEGPPMPAEQRQALRVQIGHLQKVLEEQDAKAAP